MNIALNQYEMMFSNVSNEYQPETHNSFSYPCHIFMVMYNYAFASTNHVMMFLPLQPSLIGKTGDVVVVLYD